MKTRRLLCALVHREFFALLSHRLLVIGLGMAGCLGWGLQFVSGTSESGLWVMYQLIYYAMPLLATLTTIMVVRQDLREAPLLALLPGSSVARVAAKTVACCVYLFLVLLLLMAPSALLLGGSLKDWISLAAGGCLVVAVFVALGVWRGFRARHEVRAYLGGLAWWFMLLVGSGAIAYGAHLVLSPGQTPAVTLFTLMANPLESFRLFVFFELGSIPMNPQTANPLAVWWMKHSLLWLTVITAFACLLPLLHAGSKLRLRAHSAE